MMSSPTIQTKRWTRQEYDRMAEAGIFNPDERVELLDGEILVMTPQNSPHSVAIGLVHEALQRAFGPGYWVRVQMPLIVDPDSEPEPDVAVVPGLPRDYVKAHPNTALLVVEVADTTLDKDHERKAPIYARAGIPEYWIVNLVDRRLEVYRDPIAPPGQPARYRSSRTVTHTETISTLSTAQTSIAVADLLP